MWSGAQQQRHVCVWSSHPVMPGECMHPSVTHAEATCQHVGSSPRGCASSRERLPKGMSRVMDGQGRWQLCHSPGIEQAGKQSKGSEDEGCGLSGSMGGSRGAGP